MGRQKAKAEEKRLQEGKIVFDRLKHHTEMVEVLRLKYGLPTKGLDYFYKDKQGNNNWETAGQPIYDWEKSLSHEKFLDFEKDLGKLINKLKIPHRYYYLVLNHIRYNESDPIEVFGDNKHIDIGISKNTLSGRDELILVLDADTKKKDLISPELWERIKRLQKQLPDYKSFGQRRVVSLDKLEKIYNWHYKDRLTYREINKKFPEINLKPMADYQSVGTLIARYKKHMELPIKTRKRRK